MNLCVCLNNFISKFIYIYIYIYNSPIVVAKGDPQIYKPLVTAKRQPQLYIYLLVTIHMALTIGLNSTIVFFHVAVIIRYSCTPYSHFVLWSTKSAPKSYSHIFMCNHRKWPQLYAFLLIVHVIDIFNDNIIYIFDLLARYDRIHIFKGLFSIKCKLFNYQEFSFFNYNFLILHFF